MNGVSASASRKTHISRKWGHIELWSWCNVNYHIIDCYRLCPSCKQQRHDNWLHILKGKPPPCNKFDCHTSPDIIVQVKQSKKAVANKSTDDTDSILSVQTTKTEHDQRFIDDKDADESVEMLRVAAMKNHRKLVTT